jgi:hypothetical protein
MDSPRKDVVRPPLKPSFVSFEFWAAAPKELR